MKSKLKMTGGPVRKNTYQSGNRSGMAVGSKGAAVKKKVIA